VGGEDKDMSFWRHLQGTGPRTEAPFLPSSDLRWRKLFSFIQSLSAGLPWDRAALDNDVGVVTPDLMASSSHFAEGLSLCYDFL
jgi:hypothetical protein